MAHVPRHIQMAHGGFQSDDRGTRVRPAFQVKSVISFPYINRNIYPFMSFHFLSFFKLSVHI